MKLQYVLQETLERKEKVFVVYLDWFSAFTSVHLEKLYQVMTKMGMKQTDVDLIRDAHQGTWTKVTTAYGETAEVPTSRDAAGRYLEPLTVYTVHQPVSKTPGDSGGRVHSRVWGETECGMLRR